MYNALCEYKGVKGNYLLLLLIITIILFYYTEHYVLPLASLVIGGATPGARSQLYLP